MFENLLTIIILVWFAVWIYCRFANKSIKELIDEIIESMNPPSAPPEEQGVI